MAARWPVVVLVVVIIVVIAGAGYWITSSAPQEVKKLRIGVAMWGYHDEGLWDTNAWEALLRLKEKYPIEIGYSEEVDLVKIDSVLRAMAKEYDIVWAHSSSYEDFAKKVAMDYPDTIFLVEYALDRGRDYYPRNVICAGQDPEEACFLVGALAAKMSKTHKMGVIQAINDPLDTLYSAAFRDGVHYVDPEATVDRVIMEAYLDPVKTRDSVRAFAEAGCDVVFVSMDDDSGTLEAKAQGIYSCQHYKDITDTAPDTVLNNALWNFDSILEQIILAIQQGRYEEFRNEKWFIPLTLKDGTCGLGKYGNMVPQDVKDYIDDLKNKIINGEIVVQQKLEW